MAAQNISAIFAGAGALTAAVPTIGASISAIFAGSGLFLPINILSGQAIAATFTGSGALSAGTTGSWYISAHFAGSLVLNQNYPISAVFVGAGALTANPSRSSFLAAPWRGAGALTATLNQTQHIALYPWVGRSHMTANVYRVQPTAPLVPYAGDRHVRRTADDYAQGFAALLPPGAAWPREPTSLPMIFISALQQIFGFFDSRAADLLETESDPRQTVELLPDWERNWGLPDLCVSEPLTIHDRQIALVTKMTLLGGQSRQFFLDAAAAIGYQMTITEYSPYTCGISQCGDTRDSRLNYRWMLGAPTIRYFWTVNVGGARLTWFRCGPGGGQCGLDPMCRISIASDLECLIQRWHPAHTIVNFNFAGLANYGPQAGTP